MTLDELIIFEVASASFAWGRKGNKIVKQFRCGIGPRKGRKVDTPAACFAPIDLQKRLTMQKTRKIKGRKMAKKRKRTMRTNPTSMRLRKMNRTR